MSPPRSKLRRTLALEFVLIAGAVHLVLIVLIIGIREGQLRRQFDGELLRRAERIAGAAAQDLVPHAVVPQAAATEVGQAGSPPLVAQTRDLNGRVLSATPDLNGNGMQLPFERNDASTPPGPFFATVEGARLGRANGPYRLVTLLQDGPPPYYLQIASSRLPVEAAVVSLRRMLFVFAFPAAMIGTGVAGWLISGHVVRRIDDVARAAQRINPLQQHPRLDLPAAGDEIGGMVVEMNSMLSRLENAFRAQEQFIVDVTHELKTPVSVMLAEAQVLKNSRSATVERYHEFVVSVEEEMRRLGSLLESFLTLARSGHGSRYVSESLVDLADIVLEAIHRSDSVARERRVGVTFLLPADDDALAGAGLDVDGVAIRGDQELLTTLVGNLVRNAIDSSAPNTTVEVGITVAEEHAKVTIACNPGESAASVRGRELAFDVAKGIAELHGGELRTATRGSRQIASLLLPVVRAA